jgi:hypothetical protein
MIAGECSGEQIGSFPQSTLSTMVLHDYITWGMNNRLFGGCSSEMQTHSIDTTTIIVMIMLKVKLSPW